MQYPNFRIAFLFLSLLCANFQLRGQEETATIVGDVREVETNDPVDFVTIYIKNSAYFAETTSKGKYSLKAPVGKKITVIYSRLGYKEASKTVGPFKANQEIQLNAKLAPDDSDFEVVVTENKIEEASMIRENVEEFKTIPTASGNFESILPHIALGTSVGTGGELSSQYNVRGGNYDENLVYVNDFEVYRPQLVRNSQQEGLSFPNIDLIRDLSFSSGGFDAKYGDKMSSVLDIRYKRPEEFKSSFSLSLLGASAHFEGSKKIGSNDYKKFRYLVGARYKTNSYLLSSLETKGEYVPRFGDIQTYLTYDISRDWQIGAIANYNTSQFNFVPRESERATGLIDLALRLSTAFEGQEKDEFTTGMTGVSLTYLPDRLKNPLYLKFLASNYLGKEIERFDIIGYYRLSQIETDLGSDEAGEEVAILGQGVQHTFGRNSLQNRITNFQHKGGIEFGKSTGDDELTISNFMQWGVKIQGEKFIDKLNEWEKLDSAGFSLPFDENQVNILSVIKSENEIISTRGSAFVQNTYSYRKENGNEIKATYGLRTSYWDLNKEFLLSPRAQILYKPLGWKNDFSFKLASGVYYQPPVYRELRRPDGSLNRDLKSQRSIHLLGGLAHDFYWHKISDKKFKLIAEAYYKKLDNLVSYEIDNVRIRYAGENNARGHVSGLDVRINGEFVPGAESWLNIGILSARESINGVDHLRREIGDTVATAVGFVPRPTDQLVTVSLFFQDYLPSNKNFKMHLNLIYGTGLPFGIKDDNLEYRNVYRYREYQRVDIGFSWLLWNESWKSKKPNSIFRNSRNIWLGLEVFNLIGIENVASNTWIKTIFESQYAIPNNLTSRRVNLRLKVDL